LAFLVTLYYIFVLGQTKSQKSRFYDAAA